jgi:hypothetical protein
VLENDISTLLLVLENFFVWPSSAPRYGDAQNAAFDKIQELLKEMRQRYPLEPPRERFFDDYFGSVTVADGRNAFITWTGKVAKYG